MLFGFYAHLFDAQFCLYRQLYLTDLATRESLLLCTGEHPVLQLAMHDDSIWVATTDSSVHRWPAEGCNPQKAFQRGGSFLAGNLSFSRARVSLEGSTLWVMLLSVFLIICTDILMLLRFLGFCVLLLDPGISVFWIILFLFFGFLILGFVNILIFAFWGLILVFLTHWGIGFSTMSCRFLFSKNQHWPFLELLWNSAAWNFE